jgi:glutaredoxin
MTDLGFLRGHSLVVYSSNGCPDCVRLEHWMQRAGMRAETVLIDEAPGAADKLERETGKQAVPFILVDGRAWVRGYHREKRGSFDEATLLAELRAAVGA